MKRLHEAAAGTENKEDLRVSVRPGSGKIEITVHSTVGVLFGRQIERAARDLLEQFGIDDCIMEIEDKSALDYVVRARIETALRRGLEGAE